MPKKLQVGPFNLLQALTMAYRKVGSLLLLAVFCSVTVIAREIPLTPGYNSPQIPLAPDYSRPGSPGEAWSPLEPISPFPAKIPPSPCYDFPGSPEEAWTPLEPLPESPSPPQIPLTPGYNSPPSAQPTLPVIPVPAQSPTFPPSSGIKAAYWPSGRSLVLPASAIKTAYFTHIYYAFVLPDPTTYELVITQADDLNLQDFAGTLHSAKPPARALVSIGGGGSNATLFSNMVSSSSTRKVFIESAISVVRNYSLDGLDLDWEFPTTNQDMENLAMLFAEWRAAVTEEADATGEPPLLLTAAVYFASRFLLTNNSSYPGAAMAKNLDWINAMCFDYHGGWDPSETGAHAALYDPNSDISTSYGIDSWINEGVPSQKVVIGLPLYGRSWLLKDAAIHGIGAPAVGVGPGDAGAIIYTDLVDLNRKNKATVVYDKDTVSMYSYAGTTWIGFDGPMSVYVKMKYARDTDLGGYFFWALSYDKNWTISRRASVAWEIWRSDN